MATETEIENFLTLFGFTRGPKNDSALRWDVYKNGKWFISWTFSEPIQFYVDIVTKEADGQWPPKWK